MKKTESLFIRISPALKSWAEEQAKKDFRSSTADYIRALLQRERQAEKEENR